VIVVLIIFGQKSAGFEVHKEAMDGANRQTGLLGDFRSGESSSSLPQQLQHAEASLQRADVIFPLLAHQELSPAKMKIEFIA
jgi:hypothetical protein